MIHGAGLSELSPFRSLRLRDGGRRGRLRAPFLAQFRFLFVLLTSPLADLGWRPPRAERLSWNQHSTAEQSYLDHPETEQVRTRELRSRNNVEPRMVSCTTDEKDSVFCPVRGRRKREQTHDKPDFGAVAVSSWTTLWPLWLKPCVFTEFWKSGIVLLRSFSFSEL